MTFVELFDIAKNWLAENWTDLGVALLTICNASSFVIKKIFNWRQKKNDVQKTSSQFEKGQTNFSQDFSECEVNQCNAESDEGRNQTVKILGLASVVSQPVESARPVESAQPVESARPEDTLQARIEVLDEDNRQLFNKLFNIKIIATSKVISDADKVKLITEILVPEV